jgi:hypothetical protein
MADGNTSFEEWFGYNYQPIGGSIMGLSFATTADTDVLFADINAKTPQGYDYYSMTSDNGKTSGDGEYFISGDIAAIAMDGDMKISVLGELKAVEFTIGISSFYDVVVEAYDINNNIISNSADSIGTVNLLPNTKTQPVGNPATGLQYATVKTTSPSIAYILIKSEPGFYVVDNISYVTPEPGSMLALATGLVGLLGVAARRRRK